MKISKVTWFKAAYRLWRAKLGPKQYYVYSEEPFSDQPVWRGPLSQSDALRLIAINGACGAVDRLYEDINGMLCAV